MYLTGPEEFKTLYADPGETSGWMLGCGNLLLSAGQTPLWHFADAAWEAITKNTGILGGLSPESDPYVYNEDHAHLLDLPIKRVVAENFRLYPWLADALRFDEFRTVRLIGALQFMCRDQGIEFHTQPAKIKDQAQALGVEQFYEHPLHENRHANDAKQHWWYYCAFGPDGSPSVIEEGDLASR